MNFSLTTHAKWRIKQRCLPNPNGLKMHPAGKKTARRIRLRCEKSGVKNAWGSDYVYWVHKTFIYVCVTTAPGNYLVITAWDLNAGK